MTYKLIDINESYTELETDDIPFKKKIIDTLSCYVEGYRFDPLYRAGVWDGKKLFYTIEKNHNIRFLKGLVAYVIKDLQRLGYKYTYNSIDTVYKLDKEDFKEFISTLNLPFEPYDYQVDAAYDMITQKRLTLRSCTGSGKSLIAYLFLMYMYKENKHSLLVVPSINLVDQMFSDFQEYGLENASFIIKQIGGDHKGAKDLAEKPIVISTWQSIYKMEQKEFDIFDCLLIDECHTVKGEALANVVKNAVNSQWKIGMTGTVPRTKVEKLQLLGTLGKVLKVITPAGLIDRGLATPIIINALYLNYSAGDRDEYNKQKVDYNVEKKFIAEHHYRNLKVSKILNKLAKTGNVLGLFSNIAHGEKLLKMCIQERTGINNIEILHKITPKPIKEAITKWQSDKKLLFYMNAPIEEKDRLKIIKNASKVLSAEEALEFSKTVKSLDDINIFFMTGAVSGSDREYIRKNLETVDANEINIEFNGKVISLNKNDEVPLNNGLIVKASEVTTDTDILDSWVEERI